MPNKHTNTHAWWALPDEYLGAPVYEARHQIRDGRSCRLVLRAQTQRELALLIEAHQKVCGRGLDA